MATIIGVLASAGVAIYSPATKKTRDGRRKADLEQIRSALEMYRADTGSYPASITLGGSLTYGGTTYIEKISHDPQCPDGDCKTGFGDYDYSRIDETSYTIETTLEVTDEGYTVKNP